MNRNQVSHQSNTPPKPTSHERATPRPPKPTFFERGPSPRRAGSLLILTVTVLVIIALVGIAFLQRVRLDQAATARHEREYIDQVISGVLNEISNQLKDDVFDNLDNQKELYDYPWTLPNAGIDDEYYLTNADGGYAAGQNVKVNGADNAGVMDHEDDRWLASTAPVYKNNSQPYRWLHLSNLTNFWLDLPAFGSSKTIPLERPINGNAGDPENSDTDLWVTDHTYTGNPASIAYVPAGYQQRGVDTDLDGILDAQWQWVPLEVRELGGRQYVMAVRIVDLSSMINVNTALNGTRNGFLPFSGAGKPDVMRGYDTTGVDLSRLAYRVDFGSNMLMPYYKPSYGSTNIAVLDQLQRLFDRRSLQTSADPLIPGSPTMPISAKDARTLWEKQASDYGYPDRNYQSDSEFDLRRGGGVNDYDVSSPLEEDMAKLLRQDASFENPTQWGIESNYQDVVGYTGSFESKVSKWFYGTNPSSSNDPNTDSSPVADRTFRAIRQMLTTDSGSAVYNSKTSSHRKYSLNRNFNNFSDADAAVMATRLTKALSADLADPSDNYLGLSDGELDLLVKEYVSAIANYCDQDSVPNQFDADGDGNPDGFFGLERLPFLREAYCQVLYEDTDSDGDMKYDQWSAVPGSDAIAIELGNPFSNDIDDYDLNQLLRVVIVQNGAEVGSWVYDASADGSDDIRARDETTSTDPKDIAVILRDAPAGAGAKNDDGAGQGDNLDVDLKLDSKIDLMRITAPSSSLDFNADGSEITVELQVAVDGPGGSDWVTYDRMDTTIKFDNTIPHGDSTTPTTKAVSQHIQETFWRNCDKINYVSSDTGSGYSEANNPPDENALTTPGNKYVPGLQNFSKDNKGATSGASWTPPADFQLPIANSKSMRSLAELAWLHMFGFTRSEPFSQRVGDPALNSPNQHFLVIDPTESGYSVLLPPPPNGSGVPHAALVMDMFSTVSPQEDGRDNNNLDGDLDLDTGKDESTPAEDVEQFVPGTINVNTATLPVLALASPLAEDTADIDPLVRLILAYRDEPVKYGFASPMFDDDPATGYTDANVRAAIKTVSGMDRANKPGIAGIGELLFMNYDNSGNNYNMQCYGMDGASSLPTTVDLYPDPDYVGTTARTLNEGDDNEQRLARFQMLSQALTTRSDRYVAYVKILGYEQNGFNALPVEVAQFIAIFDRSEMDPNSTSANSSVGIQFLRLQ